MGSSGRFWILDTNGLFWLLDTDGQFRILATRERFRLLDTSRLFWILGTDSSDSSEVVPRIEVCLHDITEMVVFEQT